MDSIFLYTLGYPFGIRESFIDPEIQHLSKAFKKVHILPLNVEGKKRNLPPNVEVHILPEVVNSDAGIIERLVLMGRDMTNWSFLKTFSYQYPNAGRLITKSKILKDFLSQHDPGIHYSYWFDEWAIVLSILSKRGGIDGFVSRAHGFDLFDYRHPTGHQPFRSIQIAEAKKIFSISKQGTDYFKARFKAKEKFRTIHLGTQDFGISEKKETGRLQILSCSANVPLKRINLIADLFIQSDAHVDWTHIGDTLPFDIEQYVGNRIEGTSKKLKLLGSKSHAEVLDYMKRGQVSVFVNLSETEGIPVTIMEAISFGIPIIATDVGAVAEIVNEKTGHLVQKDVDMDALIQFVNEQNSEMFTLEFRSGVRSFWESNFSADANYSAFCNEVKTLHGS